MAELNVPLQHLNSIPRQPSGRPALKCSCLCGLAWVFCLVSLGCNDDNQKKARQVSQQLNAIKTKSDSIHDATRYLSQITPQNRDKVSDEARLHLNKWLQTNPPRTSDAVPSDLVDGLPPDLRGATGMSGSNPSSTNPRGASASGASGATSANGASANGAGTALFDLWDVEYIYQCRLYRDLSKWIIELPLRDSMIRAWLAKQADSMPAEDLAQIEQACKLFDWSVRNIVTYGQATDVEKLAADPRVPLSDSGLGYRYLPWQTILYARGDYVTRGRSFTALAQQRDLKTVWVALRLPSSPSAQLWTVGLIVGSECYLFDPQLGLPILHPDTLALATLREVQNDERILRRLDVPGRYDYAVNPGDAAAVEFLIEAEPSSVSDRMGAFQSSLTGQERLRLQPDYRALQNDLKKLQPDAPIALWQLPLLARLYAQNLRSRLEMNSAFTAQYMIEHAVWTMGTSLSSARLKHLSGDFLNTFDSRGALATYTDCRLSDEKIERLPNDPDLQKQMGIPRINSETLAEYQARLQQFQFVFRQAKVDASFLLGQLHFDLGNFDEVIGLLNDRTLPNSQAARWHSAARYTLARSYQERGELKEAVAQLNQDGSPLEAGNRLRVRYLAR